MGRNTVFAPRWLRCAGCIGAVLCLPLSLVFSDPTHDWGSVVIVITAGVVTLQSLNILLIGEPLWRCPRIHLKCFQTEFRMETSQDDAAKNVFRK